MKNHNERTNKIERKKFLFFLGIINNTRIIYKNNIKENYDILYQFYKNLKVQVKYIMII